MPKLIGLCLFWSVCSYRNVNQFNHIDSNYLINAWASRIGELIMLLLMFSGWIPHVSIWVMHIVYGIMDLKSETWLLHWR
jgi:hypothetical protein